MNLSPHFTLRELSRTGWRSHQAANLENAYRYLAPLRAVATMLEVVRDHFDAPVIAHSGYRCPALNAAIGGSSTSQHMLGEAVDFHVAGVDLEVTWRWIWQASELSFGQLILEGWVAGAPSWIHLSLGTPWRDPGRCQEVLTFDGQQYRRVA